MELSWCEDYDGRAAADAFVAHHARLVAAEAQEFVFYAHWADLHAPNPDGAGRGAGSSTPRVLPGMERAKTLGGDGTPQLLEFAAAELAPLAGVAIGTIEHRIRDALDVRHRHPLLWRRTLQAAACDEPDADPAQAASMVPIWQVRKIASACHRAGLSLEQTRWVDAVTTPRLGHCGFTQFTLELEAAIIEVDPAAAAQRERAEAMRRYVTKGQTNEHGLSTLVAKVEAGDAVAFLAMVNLLADCLAADGDTSPADVRRSKAVGLIANPAAALTYLIAHGYGQLGHPDDISDPDDTGQPDSEDEHTPDVPGSANTDAASADGADAGAEGADADGAGGVGRGPDTGPRGGDHADRGDRADVGDRAGQGVLDLFADRRVRSLEGTQPAGGTLDDVPGPSPVNSRRNHDFHHPHPPDEPDPGEPPSPEHPPDGPPGTPPGAPPGSPSGEPPTGGLRPGDLHPAFDDSTDTTPAQTCPCCGQTLDPAPPAPGEDSAHTGSGAGLLSRAAVLVQRLAACGILDKITAIDPSKLRPKAVLYVHVHETSFTRDPHGVARLEDGHGPTTATRAYQLLGHHHVDVRRVIDLANQRAVEAYEVPADLREALHLLRPASVFPYAPHHGETQDKRDADHTKPYLPKNKKTVTGADPEELPQTRLDNLGFLTRRQHRIKTFAHGWIHHQPELGVHLWRTRYGYWYRVDHTGTHPLGKHPAGTTDEDLLQITPPTRPGDGAVEVCRVMTVLGAVDPVAASPLEHQLADLIHGHQPA